MNLYTDAEARIRRALDQTMFLVAAEEVGDRVDTWRFVVQGFSGSDYSVCVSPGKQTCSCPDFRQRKYNCKHIYFIVGRVLNNRPVVLKMADPGFDLFTSCPDFSDTMRARLYRRQTPHSEARGSTWTADFCSICTWTADFCSICFELPGDEEPWACPVCKQAAVHQSCLLRWTARTPSCPLCRAAVKKSKHPRDEPLWSTKRDALSQLRSFKTPHGPGKR